MWSCCIKIGFIFWLPLILYAQGFDWVPSPMLPFRIPTLYVLGAVDLAVVIDDNDRIVRQGERLCATYSSGIGLHSAVGVGLEWWVYPDATLTILSNVGVTTTTHTAPGINSPLVTGETLRTEYELTSERLTFTIQAAVRKRTMLTYGWLKVGIEGIVQFSPYTKQFERIISPVWYHFATQPPTRQIMIDSDVLTGVDAIVIPVIAIGYDIALWQGVYCSPSIEIGLPYTLKFSSSRLWHVGIKIPVAFARGHWQ